MRDTTLLRTLLPFRRLSVHGVKIDEIGDVIVAVSVRGVSRCGGCGRKRPRYDRGDGKPRRWRHLDVANRRCYLEAELCRVDCPNCGVKVEAVSWAEQGARHTRQFDDLVTWLARCMDKTAVSVFSGVSWRTVGRIIERVVRRRKDPVDLTKLRAIAIDELSFRKGHHYLTLVTDLDSGRIVWGKEGRTAETLSEFFDELGEETCKQIEWTAIDMCAAYRKAIRAKLPNAKIVYDRFHVQQLVSEAVDETRREDWRQTKGTPEGDAIKRSRYALLKSPWNLTPSQEKSLASVQANNKRVYRAYLLKETFVDIYRRLLQPGWARRRMNSWLAWASRSRLPAFVKLAGTIRKHLDGILRYFETGYTTGVAEGWNNKARLATRQAYGFHSATAVLAMIDLRCSRIDVPLPRATRSNTR
tara:strand:- start:272 stop:1516 length:1245 start_codon:yes stop_codon:yes gene_type:complete